MGGKADTSHARDDDSLDGEPKRSAAAEVWFGSGGYRSIAASTMAWIAVRVSRGSVCQASITVARDRGHFRDQLHRISLRPPVTTHCFRRETPQVPDHHPPFGRCVPDWQASDVMGSWRSYRF